MSLKKTSNFLQDLFRTEMRDDPTQSYRFKSFRLDVEERRLLDNGTPIPLTPKAFDLLALLVKRGGHLVQKEELMQTIWADSFVEEANLTRTIHTLRRALGEDNENKFIETVAKKGYRFVAEVNREHIDGGQIAPSRENGREPVTFTETPIAEPVTAGKLTPTTYQSAVKNAFSNRLVFFGLAALIGTALVAFLALTWKGTATGETGPAVSIVILPFRPYDVANRDEDYDLFFADFLIAQLSQGTKNLQVRPVNSMRNYMDVKQDAVAIGREQKANYVFESNYSFADGTIRGTWRLLNVSDGSVEATSSYSLDGSNRYTTAESVVLKIVPDLLAKLRFAPIQPVLNRGTSNEAAWRHWVQGTNLTNRRELPYAEKGVAEFEQAVRIDPEYADGWVGLAYAHETSFINGGEREKHCPQAREAAVRALQLAPDLGDAHAIYGINMRSCFGDEATAENSFKRALELAPNSAFVRRFYGIYLTGVGRGDESVVELEKAIELEPNLPWTERLLGRALFFARRYDKAIGQVKKARQLDQNDIVEQTGYLFMSYEKNGDFRNAFEWFLVFESLKGTGQPEINSFKEIHARAGWQAVLRRRLEIAEEKERSGGQNYGEIASLAAQIGDKDKAFAYLEKALPKGQLFMSQLAIDPNLDSLRDDPRYKAIYDQNWPK